MKKILLTLLLLVSVGIAAMAQTPELTLGFLTGTNTGATSAGKNTAIGAIFDSNSTSYISSMSTKKNVYPATANGVRVGATAGGKFVFTLKSAINATKVNIIGKTYKGSNQTKLSKSQITFNDIAGEEHNYTQGTEVDYTDSFVLDGSPLTKLTISVSTGIYISKIEIYTESTPATKIDLTEADLVITDASGKTLDANGKYDYEKATDISFSYNSEENAEISYSYSVNGSEAIEGNKYSYPCTDDVTLVVTATSNNSVSKTITLQKQYPTECPKPEFSIADGATVIPGKTITVSCEGAKTLTWNVNGTDIAGTSYTVEGQPGDQLTFSATASIDGRNAAGQLETLYADNTITVTVVEAPLAATFDWDNTFVNWKDSNSNNIHDTTENQTIDGITLTVSGRHATDKENSTFTIYRTAKKKNQKGDMLAAGTITITAPAGYYLTDVKVTGSPLENTDYKELSDNTDDSITTITFTHTGTTSSQGGVKISTIEVTLGRIMPSYVTDSFKPTYNGRSIYGWFTVKYTFQLENYFNHELEFEMVVKNGDTVIEDLTTTHTKPQVVTSNSNIARAAGVSTLTMKSTAIGDNLNKYQDQPLTATIIAKVKGLNTELFSQTVKSETANITTGIEDVTVDADAPAEYFTLQGVRVSEPQAGQLYIKRQGGKATKVFVK